MSELQFPDGEFYSCTDPESLHCETPGEAVEEYLDGWATKDCDMAALIREHGDVTVTAYVPIVIEDKEIDTWADDLLETLGEKFIDYSDPDDGPIDRFPEHAEATMREAVRKIVRDTHVWACKEVGKVDLSPEQVEALMRTENPDWFEPHAAGDAPKGDDHG